MCQDSPHSPPRFYDVIILRHSEQLKEIVASKESQVTQGKEEGWGRGRDKGSSSGNSDLPLSWGG